MSALHAALASCPACVTYSDCYCLSLPGLPKAIQLALLTIQHYVACGALLLNPAAVLAVPVSCHQYFLLRFFLPRGLHRIHRFASNFCLFLAITLNMV